MTAPSATIANGAKSLRVGRACRKVMRSAAPSIAAMTARADVRNKGGMSATAARVAGSEPLKISTPKIPLPHPSVVRVICRLYAH